MQKNITKSYEKTNWIAKKTVISADLLNKIEDKLLDLDLNLANKAELNDNQVRKNATWSSNKIAEHAIEQDGLFWIEKEGNFISAANTYEYKLQEIEIFGDTWQDKDGKNLFNMNNIKSGYDFGNNGEEIAEENSFYGIDYIPIVKNTTYIPNTPKNGICRICEYTSNKTLIKRTAITSGQTYTTPEGVSYIRVAFYKAGLNHLGQLEKGTVSTAYEPYHKGDLSNIQHVGELYVDEEGEPILDNQGNKQYKIDIRSCSDNFYDEEYTKQQAPNLNYFAGGFEIPKKDLMLRNGVNLTNPKLLNKFTRYNLKFNCKANNTLTFKVGFKYSDGTKTMHTLGDKFDGTISVKSDTGKTITDVGILGMWTPNGDGYLKCSNIQISSIDDYVPNKSVKQTILLPCQLMKVGDVKDRLFWDESKGKYIVEKNVGNFILDENSNVRVGGFNNTSIPYKTFEMTIPSNIDYGGPYYQTEETTFSNICDWTDWGTLTGKEFEYYALGVSNRFVLRLSDNRNILDVGSFIEYIRENNIVVYYKRPTPEFIETNITEPLYLPTYNNKTYLYINNTNNAKTTIKAKFPLKTASAVANLKLENTKNSKDILDIKELNVNMLATNFDMDYRLLELEWALEDAGMANINLLNTLNIDTKNNNKTLTRYEQAKIIITKQAYEYEILAKQLSRYLEKDIITQDEYNELIALMEENE